MFYCKVQLRPHHRAMCENKRKGGISKPKPTDVSHVETSRIVRSRIIPTQRNIEEANPKYNHPHTPPPAEMLSNTKHIFRNRARKARLRVHLPELNLPPSLLSTDVPRVRACLSHHPSLGAGSAHIPRRLTATLDARRPIGGPPARLPSSPCLLFAQAVWPRRSPPTICTVAVPVSRRRTHQFLASGDTFSLFSVVG
jgi:hypothetical protein